MPTSEERREIAKKLRDSSNTQLDINRIWDILDPILSTGEGSKDFPWDETFNRLANLIEPEILGDYYSLKCPKCGCDAVVINYDDYDWWTCECESCGLNYSFNPEKRINYDAVQDDWIREFKNAE